MAQSRSIKVVLVGDRRVGKTCLLYAFTSKIFLNNYRPVVLRGNETCSLVVDGVTANLRLLVSASQEYHHENLRLLSYRETDVFLLCFSISSEASFNKIETRWLPELEHHCPAARCVVVATKADLRQEESADVLVTPEAGKKLSSKIKAYSYIECSAKTATNVQEVFEEAVRAVLQPIPSRQMEPCCRLF
ncbi:rho-related GTP-binding protein RhoG-like [Haemaphysalis longicornis]